MTQRNRRPTASKTELFTVGVLAALALLNPGAGAPRAFETADARTIVVFRDHTIHFAPDDSAKYESGGVTVRDKGRVIAARVELPPFAGPVRITGRLALRPIPKDELEMYDRWDRAGNVRLEVAGGPDVELIKFVTAHGGPTEFEVDLSPLAPLLAGPRVIKGFVDTWVTPGWRMDFSLTYAPDSQALNADWAAGLLYEEAFTRDDPGAAGRAAVIEVPEGMERVLLHYYVSGHCTDGTDADEFVSKDNVISVDGAVVYRYPPWRDDCRRFRAINPYCRRWTDGSWSCDYSRSGWCPGDRAAPLELDLTDHLTAGRHTLRFVIEDIRPKDERGNYGYWRVSGQLLGWRQPR
ncbi:MAG TPA: peptide-N-glycosidase F-related protein [candidate division Zixibacteria bacterium]|nr:hypothetical protein [candidate division Zixibacteria bacterium]MDD4917480.1 peptide-N-glycosidase F-related protein [candidate division Zixibacteria bacterium]MDM7972305.1 peptide-N-glycosidase F-related protein [candidate division Zixibacteria bacterium]HOD67098.1 peptide-N-glycosidase F-related protein [candidate division Zixibacteria bacterium]